MEPKEIYIPTRILQRMFGYAQIATGEISGFANFDTDTMTVKRLFPLLEQTCTSGDTEITMDELHKIASTKYSKYINVWWHSHGNMGVFWSNQDETTIRNLGRVMPVVLSIVVNKREEYKARLDVFTPIYLSLDASLVSFYDLSAGELKVMEREVKQKVKSPPSIPQSSVVMIESGHATRMTQERWERLMFGREDDLFLNGV